MQELTETELMDIEIESMKFTMQNISSSVEINAETIRCLMKRVLTLEKQLEKSKEK